MTLYTDFDLSMKLTPNGDISSLSDEDCIRQVIKNSIRLDEFDIPFNDWYTPNIKLILFDTGNKIFEAELKKRIRDVLLLDPRLKDPTVEISYTNDGQMCFIDILVYSILLDRSINYQEKIDLKRVR